MSGGIITGNTSASNSGGVYNYGTFTMTDGSITGNAATTGGGVYNEEGTFNMYGGTITGNTAESGGGVYNNYGVLNASGSPVIMDNRLETGAAGNICLADDTVITMNDALKDGAAIGVTVADGRTEKSIVKGTSYTPNANDAQHIFSDDATLAAVLAGDKISLETDAAKELSGDTVTAGTTYYLINKLSGNLTIPAGDAVTINLSGYDITGTGTGPVITVESGATLNLLDSGSTVRYGRWLGDSYVIDSDADAGGDKLIGGIITGGTSMRTGGDPDHQNVTLGGGVHNEGTINMYGGCIAGNKAPDIIAGGVYNLGMINMYGGGCIAGNTATDNGGGVYNDGTGTFNMYGGSITDNRAAAGIGGGVYNKNIFSMTGGSITGNIAANAGGVCNEDAMKVSGNVQITRNKAKSAASNVYLRADKTITLTGELTAGAEIGITDQGKLESRNIAVGGGKPAYTVRNTDTAKFFSDDTDYGIFFDGGAIVLKKLPNVARIGGTEYATLAEAVDAANEAPGAITIEILGDIDVTGLAGFSIVNSHGVTIDGGGHTIKRGEGFKDTFFDISGTGALTLKNITLDGGGDFDRTAEKPLIQVDENCKFTLDSGAALQNNDNSSATGGGVYNAGTFEISGGIEITGNTSNGAASNVFLASGKTITLTGELTGEDASIGVTMETLPAYGSSAEIIVGSTDHAYSIKDTDLAKFKPDSDKYALKLNTDGKISIERLLDVARIGETTYTSLQKAIAAANAMTGPVEIRLTEDVTLDQELNITNPTGVTITSDGPQKIHTITRGKSFTGTFFNVNDKRSLTLKGITLDGGWKDTGTGLMADRPLVNVGNNARLILDDGATLQNNNNTTDTNDIDSGKGGAVYNGGRFVMSGGTITGNKSKFGGGVYTAKKTASVMENGSITNNTADQGGGVYNQKDGQFIMSGGSISGNKATGTGADNGGGVYASVIDLSGKVQIIGNTAADGVTASNVFLAWFDEYKKEINPIILTGALAQDAVIGLATETDPTDTEPVAIAEGYTDKKPGYSIQPSDMAKFRSDNEAYGFKLNANGGIDLSTQYKVTFDLMGRGSIAETMKKIPYGCKITEPGLTSEVAGYTIVGWYKDKDFAEQWTFDGNNADTVTGEITLHAKWLPNEETPAITIDYVNEKLTGFVSGATYTIDNELVSPADGRLAVEDGWFGKMISIVRKASDGKADSITQSLEIKARPAAPTEIKGSYAFGNTADTVRFTLTAVTGAEYSKDGTAWQTGNVFNNLAPAAHTFYARKAAVAGESFHSASISKEFTFAKLTGSGSVAMKDWEYDGTAKNRPAAASSTNGVDGATYLYESTDGKGYSAAEVPVNAGSYKVTATFPTTDVYNEVTATDTFTITQKSLTVSVTVKNKAYDDKNTAEIESAALVGVMGKDDVTLNNGTPTFRSAAVGTDIPIDFTAFSIEGEQAGNYTLAQPTGVKANITNTWNPAENTEYTLSDISGTDGWRSSNLVITAKGNYQLSLGNKAAGTWSDSLTGSIPGADSELKFYVKNKTTGAISLGKTVGYKLDTATPAAPTVTAKVGENAYTSETWTNGNVVFTLSNTADGQTTASGHGKYQVKIGDADWADVDGSTVTCSDNTAGTAYQFRSVNKAGKESAATDPIIVMRALASDPDSTKYTAGDLNFDKTANSDGWYKEEPTVTVTKKAHVGDSVLDATTYYTLDGGTKTKLTGPTILITGDGEHTLEIWTEDKAGNKTTAYETTVKVDITAPAGTVKFDENNRWQEFVNGITFDLFFKDTKNLTVIADDGDGSGVKKIEYLKSAEAKTLADVKTATGWTEYKSAVSVPAKDAEQAAFYVRITDNAGHVTYLSSQGVVFDTAVPVITGVENGKTYYTAQKVTVEDANLASVTLDTIVQTLGQKVTLNTVDAEKKYTITATDKAGNATTVTVTMKPLSDVMKDIKDLTEENVKSSDKEAIEATQALITALLKDPTATDSDKTALKSDQTTVKALLDKIAEVGTAMDTQLKKAAGYDAGTLKGSDKTALDAVVTDIGTLLGTKNLTAAERTKLENAKKAAEALIKKIDDDKAAMDKALTLVAGGVVEVSRGANQKAKTAAVQAYADGLLWDTGTTAAVTHKTGNTYAVALTHGTASGSKDITVTYHETGSRVDSGVSQVAKPAMKPGATQAQKDAMQKASDALKVSGAVKENGLSKAVSLTREKNGDFAVDTGAEKLFTVKKAAIEKILNDNHLTGEATMVAEAYLQVQVTGAKTDSASGITSLTFDIKPFVNVKLQSGSFSQTLVTPAIEHVGRKVIITLTLPESFTVPTGYKLQVVHTKDDGTQYTYDVESDGNKITFENPHGFSTFTVQTVPAAAQTGDGSHAILWANLTVTAACGAAYVVLYQRKKKEQDQ